MPSPPPIGPNDPEVIEQGDEDDSVYPKLLFTENETNFQRLYGGKNENVYAKDAFHDHIIRWHRPSMSDQMFGRIHSQNRYGSDEEEQGPKTPIPDSSQFVNPQKSGTKAAAHYTFRNVPGNGGCAVVRLKLTPTSSQKDASLTDETTFDETIEERREEADEFYEILHGSNMSDDLKQVMRQALGGMLWSKQYYQFIQETWLNGDPAQPPPPPERKYVRNKVRFGVLIICQLSCLTSCH